MGERHLEYEKRDNDILFFLSDHVRVSVKYASPTKVEVQMWRLDVLLPPDVGNMNAASFRRRLARDGTEAFNRDSKEGENAVPKLEEELGLVASALKSKPEDEEDEESKLTLLDMLKEMFGPSMMDLLLKYGREGELFHDPDGEPYATVEVGDHRETHHLKSKGYRSWLRHKYYMEEKKRLEEIGKPEESPTVPRSQVISDALAQLEAICQFEGPEYDVHVRVAEHEGAIYVDLADERWRAVRIDSSGWRVVSDPPVKFVRAKGMLPLPEPVAGNQGAKKLRDLLNLKDEDEDSWRLILAWLVAAFRPNRPFVVLILQGEQGSAKSTVERILRALIDPSTAPLRTTPRNEHDLYIASVSSWVVAYDNISNLPQWLSDAICKLSTGGGFSTRTLYENREQELFDAIRPVILNGITDVATRPDLLDRSIILTMPHIKEGDRKPESAIWEELAEAAPEILGFLFGAVSSALENLPATALDKLPRMADFALWVTAAEKALGWEEGGFLKAYNDNRGDANRQALEASPVAAAVWRFMKDRDEWRGTMTEFYQQLGSVATEEMRRSKAWPAAPNSLGAEMKRLAPALRAIGIEVQDYREPTAERRRMWKLSHKKDSSKGPSEPSEPSEGDKKPRKTEETPSDGFRTPSEGLGQLFDDLGHPLDSSDEQSCPKESPAKEEDSDDLDGSDGSSHPPSDAQVRALLEDPPEWFRKQATVCIQEGIPERLLNPLASAVAYECLGDVHRWREALPGVERKLREMLGEAA